MKLLRALCAFSIVFALVATASAQDSGADAEWLMVIQGEVTDVADGTLTIAVPTSAVVFTDRPERRADLIDLATFAATAWGEDGTFRADPPNASMIDESNNTIAVVTIENLAVADGMATLQVTVLQGALPAAGDVVALTIDPTSVNAQITD